MPKYLHQVKYSVDGIKGLLKEGASSRKAAVESLIKSLGGTVEAYYYAFGDTDLYIISEGADNATVAAGILAVVATGTAEVKTTVLLTTEEIDEAAKKTVQYRPPAK